MMKQIKQSKHVNVGGEFKVVCDFKNITLTVKNDNSTQMMGKIKFEFGEIEGQIFHYEKLIVNGICATDILGIRDFLISMVKLTK